MNGHCCNRCNAVGVTSFRVSIVGLRLMIPGHNHSYLSELRMVISMNHGKQSARMFNVARRSWGFSVDDLGKNSRSDVVRTVIHCVPFHRKLDNCRRVIKNRYSLLGSTFLRRNKKKIYEIFVFFIFSKDNLLLVNVDPLVR